MSSSPIQSAIETPQDSLSGNLGVPSIVFMVLAGAAPLTVVGGVMPIAFGIGNGAGVPTAFILSGLGLLLFAVGFTAMTPFVRHAGAFYSYVETGLGKRTGAGTGYVALLSYTVLYAGVYALMGTGAAALIETFDGPTTSWWIWSFVALAIVTALGYRNVELSGRVLSVLLVAEVVIVLILDARIVFSGGGDEGLSTGFATPSIVAGGAPGLAILFAVLSFIGFEATAVFRDEVKEPEKTIPRATFVALISVALFYAVTSWAMVSAIGDSNIANVEGDMLSTVSREYLAKTGSDIVAVLYVTSIFACALTFHNVVARYQFSLAKRQLVPTYVGHAHPKHRSPHRAGVCTGLIAAATILLVVLFDLDPLAEFYTWFAGLASVGYLALLSLTCLSVLVFFAQNQTNTLSVWRTRVAPIFGLLSLLGFLALILRNLMLLFGDNQAVATTAMVLLLLAFVLGFGARRTGSAEER